jgi:uncharacterized protein YcgI (DUF1989 family)
VSATPGSLVSQETVPPGNGTSGIVERGQILRIVDVEGEQVADFCSFRADDPSEYCDIIYLSPSACFNVFMNMQYKEDGGWPLAEPISKPGDYIDLRAEMDALWAVSVCQWPEVCNGDHPTPLRFEVYDPSS